MTEEVKKVTQETTEGQAREQHEISRIMEILETLDERRIHLVHTYTRAIAGLK